METSAKTGFNAQELFVKAAELLNKEFEQYQLVSQLFFGLQLIIQGNPEPPTNEPVQRLLRPAKKTEKINANQGCCG